MFLEGFTSPFDWYCESIRDQCTNYGESPWNLLLNILSLTSFLQAMKQISAFVNLAFNLNFW